MFYVKITFTPIEKIEITESNSDADSWDIGWYLGDLYRNGQAFKEWLLIFDENKYHAFLFMPEIDSLDEKYCNSPVLRSLEKIKTQFEVAIEVLGKNAYANEICTCNNSDWYILYARNDYNFSPISCGNCLKMIPIYKFPQIEMPKDCECAVSWENDYTLIDKLWISSGFDRFTYRQMSDVKSALTKSGRNICAAYEKALGKPFYYFLFRSNYSGRKRKKCPACGNAWTLEDDIGILSFKCDKCRIVSN
jgi:predicted  nucleic acid-binding Zn ribbon protein